MPKQPRISQGHFVFFGGNVADVAVGGDPSAVTMWSAWSVCSVTRGPGSMIRHRRCKSGDVGQCVGMALQESTICVLSSGKPLHIMLLPVISWPLHGTHVCAIGSRVRKRFQMTAYKVEEMEETDTCPLIN